MTTVIKLFKTYTCILTPVTMFLINEFFLKFVLSLKSNIFDSLFERLRRSLLI